MVNIPSFSHQRAYRRLWAELSLRGHEVVVITTDPMRNESLTNLKEIDLHGVYDVLAESPMKDIYTIYNVSNSVNFYANAMAYINTIIDYEFQHPEVVKLIQDKNQTFDLVIAEYVFPPVIGFSWRFNCPFIGVLSLDAHQITHSLLGNPTHPVLYPHYDLGFGEELSFFQRVSSFSFDFMICYVMTYLHITDMNDKMSRYFNAESFDFEKMQNYIKLLFINVSPVFLITRPVVPATINIGGGFHIEEAKKLPQVCKK